MKEKNLQGIVGMDRKISLFEKMVYSSTNGIGTFYYMFIQMWLLYYYTDVLKISAAFIGVLFILVRTLDAFITPIFGVYVDRQNTRWGKYKPWMVICGISQCISAFFAFMPVNFGVTGNTVYAAITYIIFSTIMSLGGGTCYRNDSFNFKAIG
jgi:Na+/melibiose symporter and related transporters